MTALQLSKARQITQYSPDEKPFQDFYSSLDDEEKAFFVQWYGLESIKNDSYDGYLWAFDNGFKPHKSVNGEDAIAKLFNTAYKFRPIHTKEILNHIITKATTINQFVTLMYYLGRGLFSTKSSKMLGDELDGLLNRPDYRDALLSEYTDDWGTKDTFAIKDDGGEKIIRFKLLNTDVIEKGSNDVS